MEILNKIMVLIDENIAKYEGQKGDYMDGAVAGLYQAKLIIQRELHDSKEVSALVAGVVEGMER